MRTNYHTHTQRCLHAQGSEEDYIRAALDAGVAVLGFSDHAPFPNDSYGLRMPFSELETYFAEVDRLRAVYADRLSIKKSLEIEYLPMFRDYYERLLTRDKVDYLLLGEHFFLAADGAVVNITIQREGTELCVQYARAVAEALAAGYFKMVAHPDIFAMAPFAWDKNCDEATDIILDAAAQTGAVLEFNANGYRRGIHPYPDGERYMYPHMNFWEKVRGSGIPVMIGSDCHNPTQVWDSANDRSLEVLAELGITAIETL